MKLRDYFDKVENVTLKDVEEPINKILKDIVKPDIIASSTVLVRINVPKFDKEWSKGRDFYIGKGGTGNAIGNRYENFLWILTLPEEQRRKYLTLESKKGKIASPEVSVSETGRIDFGNGRHRYAVLRDLGAKKIPVAMIPESARNAKKWGYI